MKDCLDILVIDDDEVDRMNVQHLLDKEGETTKPVPVLQDAFGLWDISDEQVFKNEVEKIF